MRIRFKNELLLIVIWTILLLMIIPLLPSNALRIILGVPLVLFFPGYTLMAVLFPKKGSIGKVERAALSFGVSIALVPLIGFLFNYTPCGITFYPILISLVSFVLAATAGAWYRRHRLSPEERFAIAFDINLTWWRGTGTWDRLLSGILIASILGAIGSLGYVVFNPKIGETFTEFYVLGLSGKAWDYPQELVEGEQGRVILGIMNYEREETSYRVEVLTEEAEVVGVGPVVLDHEAKWEQVVGFVPVKTGNNQKVRFLLFKNGEGQPYREAYCWINVWGVDEKFTKFYLVSFPESIYVGQQERAVLGVMNHEGESMTYRIEVRLELVKTAETLAFEVAPGEVWEQEVLFVPWKRIDRQTADFLLYKQEEEQPYKSFSLHNLEVPNWQEVK